MKAILYTEYGPPELLQFTEVEKPVPRDSEVLVKIHAASVNAMDWRRFTGSPILARLVGGGLRKPTNLKMGADIAGTVEAVGDNVTEFQPGDEVFGVCRGAFAEYVCTAEKNVSLKPANVSFEEAATVPIAAFTALQGLRNKGQIQPRQKVLINGASGGVGVFAAQIAKSFGAEVTAVCSARNLDIARSIGADHVIDYAQEDFTKNGQLYDLILAVNGYHPILAYRRALSPNGIYVAVGGSLIQVLEALLLGPLVSKLGNRKLGFMGIATAPKTDLDMIKELLETGKLIPVIDRRYPLSETVEAIRYLAEEHAQGKVVITVEHRSEK